VDDLGVLAHAILRQLQRTQTREGAADVRDCLETVADHLEAL
jgi:hypothetical protein